VIRFVTPQKQSGDDCAIVALSIFLNQPYAAVAAVVARVAPTAFKSGMWNTQIAKVAKALGTPLRVKRKFSERESGILTLQLEDACHAVVLFEGVVVNPGDSRVWNYKAYLAKACAKPLSLLVEV
jgi:hypothetical protein